MEKLANDIWIFDGEAVKFFFLPFTTRMTVIKLANGDLWVHSPIYLSDALKTQIDQLGSVKYLIAPNHLHHLFLPQWITKYPDAQIYGTDEVIKKRSDISFDASLNDNLAWQWQNEINQVLVTGSPLMEECVFFHKSSKTLIVTDLVENFSGDNFNPLQKWIAKGVGIIAPDGKTPIDWRLSFMFNKAKTRKHFEQMLAWQPEILVMAHGELIEKNAVDFLHKSFRWLTKS
ncbi:DUF4336 domain-containing protein [Pseudoalteromonas apostichopi]|uniref:DUF4336 domain-containing protein n=1 Tax=Pseudoalteromonas apostichopi TaxID=3035452 RepID=UPI002573795F|nr:DUF4336 domain-containing protein [Pseudoalteromonas sp. FE4]